MTDLPYSHPSQVDFLRAPPSPPMPSFVGQDGQLILARSRPSYSGSPGSDVPAYELPPSSPVDAIEVSSPSSLPTGLPPAFSALNVKERKEAKKGMLASLRGLTGHKTGDKDAIEIVFTEALVFIVPPRVGDMSRWYFDAGVEGDGSGKEGRINGFVHVYAHQPRLVESVCVRLQGFTQFLGNSIAAMSTKPEVFLTRELFVHGAGSDGKEVWLEQGVNTFEFTFTVPATSATSERSPTGICQYHVSAMVASSSLKTSSPLTTSREVIVVCQPHRESNVLQYQHHHEVASRIFGPYSLDMSANQMILSAPFAVSLTLAAPPPGLTIFSITAHMRQTTTLLPAQGTPVETQGVRRYIVREGILGQCGQPGWAARARAGKGPPGSTGILLDAHREGSADSRFWRWTKVGRLPNDSTLRASTLPGTVTPLRFASRLVVEVVFQEESADRGHDGTVKIATLYDQDIHISSCCCWLPYLALPTYSPDTPEQEKFRWHVDGCVGCMCDENWESLERAEIELLRGTSTEDMASDGVVTRRPLLPERKPSHLHTNGSSHAH